MARSLLEGAVNEQRIVELETRLTYQEQSLDELNVVLTEQGSRLARLERLAGRLESQLIGLAQQLQDDAGLADDKPPHY